MCTHLFHSVSLYAYGTAMEMMAVNKVRLKI